MKHHCLKKKNFIGNFNLNMKKITDADCMHAKRVCKDFEIGEYHDIYFKSDTFLLAIFLLYPVNFVQPLDEHGKQLLELLTDIDILLMVEKGIRGGIYDAIQRNTKANDKYMKEYNKKRMIIS